VESIGIEYPTPRHPSGFVPTAAFSGRPAAVYVTWTINVPTRDDDYDTTTHDDDDDDDDVAIFL
jgi:hypothetical protein